MKRSKIVQIEKELLKMNSTITIYKTLSNEEQVEGTLIKTDEGCALLIKPTRYGNYLVMMASLADLDKVVELISDLKTEMETRLNQVDCIEDQKEAARSAGFDRVDYDNGEDT